MYALLILFIAANSNKTVEVRYTEVAPKIDGVIEEVWQQADSAYDFVQFEPYEKTDPEQPTAVYVLQDENNLYIAFRCYAEKYAPIACFTKDEDHVRVSIDPFGNKTTGYYFIVFGSKIPYDGLVMDDGREWDDSWEGIWYRGVGVHDDLMEVEIKIPFKSIRYKKGLDEWGIQFMRYTAETRETDFWTEIDHTEGELVSKWGTLKGINPQASGHYFELYPESYIRYDHNWFYDTLGNEDSTHTRFKPSISFNAKWDVTPQTTINATAYPDFAQIESDPFTLNLSRYPTYLHERRPFFIEGTDIFHMSGFGGWGFFEDLELYYSRRIGRSINGDAVPIIGGLKVTHKSPQWDVGLLGAYTDEYSQGDSVLESSRKFSVLRAKHRILENSSIGILHSGTLIDSDNYNHALGLDLVYRQGTNQFITQGAVSRHTGKIGWAFTSGFLTLLSNFRVFGSAIVVQDSFDVSDIGFVPWTGYESYRFYAGPVFSIRQGFLRQFATHVGGSIHKEPGADDYSYEGMIEVMPNYRNRWGNYLSLSYGKQYEADTHYTSRSAHLSTWGSLFSQIFEIGGWGSYTYNYMRGFPAYQGGSWLVLSYSILPSWSTGIRINHWVEWDTTNTIISMIPRVRPNFFFRFTADMSLSLFSEFVWLIPGSDLSERELYSVRPGLLYSWNFRPKSWIYIALNDYHSQDMIGDLQHRYLIGAVKLNYLLYF